MQSRIPSAFLRHRGPDPGSPRRLVVVYVEGGVVQWTASSDPGVDIAVLDGDTEALAVGWIARPRRLSEMDPDLYALAGRLRSAAGLFFPAVVRVRSDGPPRGRRRRRRSR